MKISNVQVTRIKMPRADPTWRTASYAGNAVEGFLLQIHADGVTGLGGTAAHPRNIAEMSGRPSSRDPFGPLYLAQIHYQETRFAKLF